MLLDTEPRLEMTQFMSFSTTILDMFVSESRNQNLFIKYVIFVGKWIRNRLENKRHVQVRKICISIICILIYIDNSSTQIYYIYVCIYIHMICILIL